MTHAAALACALILDALFGEPRSLWSRLTHPAVLMGQLVGAADRSLNTGPHRRLKGVATLALLVTGAALCGWLLSRMPGAFIVETLLAAVLLAQRSLADHVKDVARALRLSVGDGRRAVARIVGRDTAAMDGPAISRAAIESAAENFSDGVVAPAFWFLVAGLPGLLVYKTVNTADSMIGYRTPRHAEFGWASARFDDLLNWIPARATALLIWLIHGRPVPWSAIRRDAALHRSPNAGWPEAATAPALGIALSGPRSYDGELRDFPYVHPDGDRNAGPDHIDASVALLWRSWAALLALSALLAVA